MSTLVVKTVLFLPIAILYGAVGMAIARFCFFRMPLRPDVKRWLFCVSCTAIFSPVVVLTSAIGAFVVPLAVAPFTVFLWHPVNLGSVLLYSATCFYISNRWFASALPAESSWPWRWPIFWRWFLTLLVALPVVAGMSVLVPPFGFLIATLWIFSPLATILICVVVALVVAVLATTLSARSGPPNSRLQSTQVGAADPER